jgi:hypothetical protein
MLTTGPGAVGSAALGQGGAQEIQNVSIAAMAMR